LYCLLYTVHTTVPGVETHRHNVEDVHDDEKESLGPRTGIFVNPCFLQMYSKCSKSLPLIKILFCKSKQISSRNCFLEVLFTRMVSFCRSTGHHLSIILLNIHSAGRTLLYYQITQHSTHILLTMTSLCCHCTPILVPLCSP
jgi:hypothetical protein